ncbi:hypothetical protein GGR58DRAFT_510709 [Xylaria digitata]|nr:hypothetical protein GGR58DRAFT_510709 [Xylaria digitata]
MTSMPQTHFNLSEVDIPDAEDIIQYVEIPAMQNGPLYRTMFPQFDSVTEAQKGQIIRWYTEMLEDAFQNGQESFLKACSVDGIPVGFCGWTVIERNSGRQVEATDGQAGEPRNGGKAKKSFWAPEVIDIDGWTALSTALKAERCRVLKDLDNICRLTFMAVDPKYQRQGIGSMMMQRICEETDQQGRCAYMLAAPEGGHVESTQGVITSMFRPARTSLLTSGQLESSRGAS